MDDGLNTGLLQLAALAALRHYHSQRRIVATPFGTPAALGHIARRADELVTLTYVTGEHQDAITHWQYTLGDDDAAALLHRWQVAAAIGAVGRAALAAASSWLLTGGVAFATQGWIGRINALTGAQVAHVAGAHSS